MNTLIRNSTTTFNRGVDVYEPLDPSGATRDANNHDRGTYSRRRHKKEPHNMVHSVRYKRDRAKQRRIFLKTYELKSMDTLGRSRSRKQRKMVFKMKKVVLWWLVAELGNFRVDIEVKPIVIF
ncbi:hypothetical protein FCV25MIE_05304 [Fagus crenata]